MSEREPIETPVIKHEKGRPFVAWCFTHNKGVYYSKVDNLQTRTAAVAALHSHMIRNGWKCKVGIINNRFT